MHIKEKLNLKLNCLSVHIILIVAAMLESYLEVKFQ
jgi:hypothetical protein